ncbi:MAG: AsmA family protein, partial [Candidatus Omnitrophica bacterium]|nr:AsmA family protein [Candidatus Omnitrophota bacterium]
MKLLMKLVVLVVVVLVILVLARNVVVKAAVENGVKAATGMPLSMGKLDLNFQNSFVDLENLVVKNASGFHDTSLVEIPKIFVGYNLSDILKGNVHLSNIEFDMKQFTVVKNEKGELNLDRLKALQGTQKAPAGTPQQEPKAPAKPIPVQIDKMRLQIGKVVYIDYSGGQPTTKEFKINLDQSYENITDLNSVVRLIVLKAMMSSGISNLVNFDIGGLEGTLTGAFDASAKLATQAAAKGLNTLKTVASDPSTLAGQAGSVLKGTTGTVGSTAKEVAGGVKDAASSLKSKLKLPF